jgi:hypothetical protein
MTTLTDREKDLIRKSAKFRAEVAYNRRPEGAGIVAAELERQKPLDEIGRIPVGVALVSIRRVDIREAAAICSGANVPDHALIGDLSYEDRKRLATVVRAIEDRDG